MSVSYEFYKHFKNTFFTEHLWAIAFEIPAKQSSWRTNYLLKLKLTKSLMSFFKQKVSFSSKFCVMRDNCSLFFIAETLSAINKRNTSKCTFLDFCLLTWKLTKFLMSFFKQKVSYFSKFCIMRDNSSVLFIAETLSAIDKRVLLKSKFSNFQLLTWKLTKFLISFLKPPVSFSLNIA